MWFSFCTGGPQLAELSGGSCIAIATHIRRRSMDGVQEQAMDRVRSLKGRFKLMAALRLPAAALRLTASRRSVAPRQVVGQHPRTVRAAAPAAPRPRASRPADRRRGAAWGARLALDVVHRGKRLGQPLFAFAHRAFELSLLAPRARPGILVQLLLRRLELRSRLDDERFCRDKRALVASTDGA